MANIVLLETRREGYSTSQITHTFTVGELINELSCYDEDALIMFSNDGGYTYGSITSGDFREEQAYE